MIKLDEQYARQSSNYLENKKNDWKKRAIVLSWVMEESEESNCKRQTFATCVSMFDRFLVASSIVPVDSWQLIALACLHLAEKFENRQRIGASSFYTLLVEKYTKDDIQTMQIEIANTLIGFLKVPTPTIVSWANMLCIYWDRWISAECRDIDVMFKDA